MAIVGALIFAALQVREVDFARGARGRARRRGRNPKDSARKTQTFEWCRWLATQIAKRRANAWTLQRIFATLGGGSDNDRKEQHLQSGHWSMSGEQTIRYHSQPGLIQVFRP